MKAMVGVNSTSSCALSKQEDNVKDFEIYQKICANRVETFLKVFLDKITSHTQKEKFEPEPEQLYEAVKYAIFNGGKRLRPLLVYATGEAFQTPLEKLHASAAAVELIHCFSLVHDDLPAMDNDDFRRGKPTCHKVFGEANAILAGDALQSLSFELLSQSEFNPNPIQSQLKMIHILSKATGIHGMVGGQALDIAAESLVAAEALTIESLPAEPFAAESLAAKQEIKAKSPSEKKKPAPLQDLIALHQKKTGVLISASVAMGLEASQCHDENIIAGLNRYANLLGLAFQVQDDILDVEGSLEELGKTPGKDVTQDKLTFPILMGLKEAKEYKKSLHLQILDCLATLPFNIANKARFEQISYFFLERQY